MQLALEYRQAVVMRPYATEKNRVAVVEQVVRGDGGGDGVRCLADVLRRLTRGDVLQHHAQARELLLQWHQRAIQEHLFPIEDIHFGIGDFTMQQQGQIDPLHRLQHRPHPLQIGDTGIGIGGGTGRVVLHRMHQTAGTRLDNVLDAGVIGEIQRHQGLELQARRQRGENAIAVFDRGLQRGHRRTQIRHDDGTGELARGVAEHRCGSGTIAQMQMPVIRLQQAQTVTGDAGRRRGCRTIRVHHPRSINADPSCSGTVLRQAQGQGIQHVTPLTGNRRGQPDRLRHRQFRQQGR